MRNPSNAGVRWQLAAVLAGTGRKTEARSELQEALRLEPRLAAQPDVQKLQASLQLP